jgi:hypothetical protein
LPLSSLYDSMIADDWYEPLCDTNELHVTYARP